MLPTELCLDDHLQKTLASRLPPGASEAEHMSSPWLLEGLEPEAHIFKNFSGSEAGNLAVSEVWGAGRRKLVFEGRKLAMCISYENFGMLSTLSR